MTSQLPIDPIIPDLILALQRQARAVLQAPPGAGKTTRVPLALLPHVQGRILMLEPRRLAARAAAERMAQSLGEALGETVGYRIRGEAKTSAKTRIEVVTEGILTRMLQSDPELSGIGAVIFDEFHERSLHADLGLALTLEVKSALRPDLWLLVMSATLDAAPVAALLGDAPLITSEGQAFPVETIWLDRPLPANARIERETARLVEHALSQTTGGVLVFLPGEGEIRRTAALLAADDLKIDLQPLYGAMDFRAQQAALKPSQTGLRKVVLATSIAETSLTIPDIRVVIDAGRARRARFDAGSGMSRLVTERVSRAEATQRRGRAGRVAPGRCYRLWAKAEEGALPAFPPAEIEAADLAPLALELALWGGDEGLKFLTPPPEGTLAEARKLLISLGALDKKGRITTHGQAIARLPVHPRLAHMLILAGSEAAPLAALVSDRDPLVGAPPDLSLRLLALQNPRDYGDRHPWPINRDTLDRIRAEAKRLAKLTTPKAALSAGAMLALAYPDRIGLRRKGEAPRWVLSGGKGATMPAGTPLAGARLLVASDLDGDTREANVRQALPLSEADLRSTFPDQIQWLDICEWSRRESRILARRQERFGALVLEDRIWQAPPPEAMAEAALEGLHDEVRQGNGLPFTGAAARLRARAESARTAGIPDIPAVDEESLLTDAKNWLLPALTKVRTREDLRRLDLLEPLRLYLGWTACQTLEGLYPSHFTSPLGRRIPIDYEGDQPQIELRLQELFGQTTHPTTGPARTPLRLVLVSPGGKPIAVTSDLPGFWRGSYADVRKDMRGRYPRHPWPEDPTEADPTLRAKPRGT